MINIMERLMEKAPEHGQAIVWTGEQLSGLFLREARNTMAAAPPENGFEDEPVAKPLTLDEELSSPQVGDRGLLALKTGYYNNKGANTYVNSDGESDGSGESKEEREAKKKINFRHLETSLAHLEFDGIQMTEKEAFQNLYSASKRLGKQQDRNLQSAEVSENQIARDENGNQIETREELKAHIKGREDCLVVDLRAAEELSVIDGQLVDTELYHAMVIENQQLAEQQERIQQYTVQLEQGDITWEQLPEDISAVIAEEHRNDEQTVQPETVLDQLNMLNAEAQMQDVVKVTPTVTYSSLTPAP